MTSRREGVPPLYGVILAGGRGTRFWPRSRTRLPKQLLPVVGEESLLRQTVDRLGPLIPPERIWVLASEVLRRRITRELPEVPASQIVAEPVQRNTGPAIALAARLVAARDGGAILGIFPSDHFIATERPFLAFVRRAAQAARRGDLVVFGIPPRWPETGYGYIEYPPGTRPGAARPVPVVRFREKPALAAAKRFLKGGHFYWNSGMFVWQARTITEAVERFMPATAAAIAKIEPPPSRGFARSLRTYYPRCENKSIDYGVLEHAPNIVGFACSDFGWNDLGSWEAVYKLLPKDGAGNVARSPILAEKATGNYVDAPGKLVALAGVDNLVVVDTPDALLICRREGAQQVSALVQALEKAGLVDLI